VRLRSIVGAAGLATLLLAPTVALTAPASAAPAPTAPTVPTAPRTPAIAPGHGRATVTWTAPASSGGAPITAYRIRVAPGDRTVTVAAPATIATITGLADGTQVTASVLAINRVGTSPAADAGSTIPTPPIATVLTAADGDHFQDLAVADDGTTYLAQAAAIARIDPDGTVTPLALGDIDPWAVALAPDGDLYWIDGFGSSRYLVKRLHDGHVETVAGTTDPNADFVPSATPVPALQASLASPLDLVINPVDGSVLLVDVLCGVVERFTVGGDLAVVAGTAGSCGPSGMASDGDGGPATSAHLAAPQGLAIDEAGTVYIAEEGANRVRRFTVGGTITTVAGDGSETIDPAADLPATETGVPGVSRISWAKGRGLLIDAVGRERLLVGDRLRRLGPDAYDRALTAVPAPPGDGPIAANDATLSIDWTGPTLRVISLVPKEGGGWRRVLKSVGPWLPATEPTDHPGFGSWEDLVTLHHRAIIGRAPTAAERTSWVAALDAGTKTPGQLDDALRRSSENVANVDPVVRLYRAFLGRVPDAGGLRFWIARKRNVAPARTWSVSQMAASFVASGEFQRKYGSLTNRAFVTRIYTDVLGRPADPTGVDFWTKRLDTKRMTRAQVMVGFSESSEYRRKQAANTDVAVAYLDLVGRMPTAEEAAAWTTASSGGATHVELLDQLVKAAPALL
jgi:hypothetical protein